MDIVLDIARLQQNKYGEELCGDTIEIARAGEHSVIVLADGLGSGVKASILSSLTAKMACTMLKHGEELESVIECLAHTLPVCRVRHLAYSTFTIVSARGRLVYLAEYDNPPAIISDGLETRLLLLRQRELEGKTVKERFFELLPGDWIVLVSDGVLHAGIGGVWNLGWGFERVKAYIKSNLNPCDTAAEWAWDLMHVVEKLYGGKPGDDASLVVLRARERRHCLVLTGPPADRRDDARVLRILGEAPGWKIVAGGSTSNMISRLTGERLEVDLSSDSSSVPPMGRMPGVDLVTEGVITLSHAAEKLGMFPRELRSKRDGASQLAFRLLLSDDIHFVVGTARNPALDSQELAQFSSRSQVVGRIAEKLREQGKSVKVDYV
ncbi:MAG: SpoIIE family protein phosphatase [Bacillota bacterium]